MKKNVYVNARHSELEERKFDVDIGEVEKQLKPMIVGLVEKAFRKYCKAHGADIKTQDIEWQRFQKILSKTL